MTVIKVRNSLCCLHWTICVAACRCRSARSCGCATMTTTRTVPANWGGSLLQNLFFPSSLARRNSKLERLFLANHTYLDTTFMDKARSRPFSGASDMCSTHVGSGFIRKYKTRVEMLARDIFSPLHHCGKSASAFFLGKFNI